MKTDQKFKLTKIITLILFAECAYAIDVPPLGGFLPGPALPEQVSKAITNQNQVAAPTHVLPPVITQPEKPSPLAEQAKKIKFKLNGIILEGNHVYSNQQLKMLYQNKLHKEISVAQLFDIVQSITNYYRNNGYILSRAILPPQHVKNGVVKIRVIEGFIENVNVIGTPYGAKCLAKAFGQQIKNANHCN